MPLIYVRRLWRERNIGRAGWIGAELVDGTLVALCSVEKWDLGVSDSLRRGWINNEKHFIVPKRIVVDVTLRELREDGLGSGKLRMQGRPD